MSTDLATQLVTMKTVQTQNSVQLAVVKKAHEMQTDLLETLMQSALPAPPAGQGVQVDKRA